MKRSFLAKLQINGLYYLSGAGLLLLGVPLYQLLVLIPQGYSDTLASTSKGSFSAYVLWIGTHIAQFLGYRIILIIAFAALLNLPFTLFRIIIAQEILGREEETKGETEPETDGMPAFAWRGKGFAVLAAWSGFLGILLYVLGTLASTLYLTVIGSNFSPHDLIPANFSTLFATFIIITNSIGGGLLALAFLFFGAIIARSGLNLWPGIWVTLGYLALPVAALFSGSAVAVASAPTAGQTILTTPAILLFALWVLCFGAMLVRLKPET